MSGTAIWCGAVMGGCCSATASRPDWWCCEKRGRRCRGQYLIRRRRAASMMRYKRYSLIFVGVIFSAVLLYLYASFFVIQYREINRAISKFESEGAIVDIYLSNGGGRSRRGYVDPPPGRLSIFDNIYIIRTFVENSFVFPCCELGDTSPYIMIRVKKFQFIGFYTWSIKRGEFVIWY